jgi:hypothetical protein
MTFICRVSDVNSIWQRLQTRDDRIENEEENFIDLYKTIEVRTSIRINHSQCFYHDGIAAPHLFYTCCKRMSEVQKFEHESSPAGT